MKRFHHEQRILTGLDHPYISRMLDASNTREDELMEYMDALPIDAKKLA